MLMVSDRTKKIVFSLAYIAVIALAASTGFASEGGEGAHHVDSGAQMKDFGWRVLNFVLLIGILVFAIKKADVKGSLAARQSQIEKDLREAQEGKAAAEAKLAEYSAKLSLATKEIDELQAAIIREGEQEKERIIAEARIAAQKIAAQAAQSADQEIIKARSELRAEAARLAVEIATGKLTGAIQKADHDRFVGEYLDKVVQIGSEGGLIGRFRDELTEVDRIFSANPDLKAVFANPAFTSEQKKEIMKDLIARVKSSELVGNFLLLLVDKNRVAFLDQIVRTYETLADDQSGIIRPIIKTAFALDDGQVASIQSALEKKSGKKIIPQITVDKSLLGGVVTQIGDTAFDSSVKTQLKRIQDILQKG